MLAATTTTAAHADSPLVAPPDQDPFYAPPTGFAHAADGAILRTRTIVATTFSVPLPAQAEQILYRTEDSSGHAIAEATTVLVPFLPWLGSGSRPLVSYQTAEDSVGSQCEPSYALRVGLPAVTSNSESESSLIAALLAKGYAVVTSDYEGPDSDFLAGPQEGKGVLDGIRAARASGFAGLGTKTPVGLWGYSGGAFATAWAVEQQPTYAPELKFVGSAMGGVPADLEPTMRNVDGGFGAGLVMGGLIGIGRAYPKSGIAGLFTPSGQAALDAGSQDCTVSLIARYAFTPLSAYTYSAAPYDEPALESVLAKSSPIGHGASASPVYSYHADTDELVPVDVANRFVASYCAAGTPVQTVRYAVGEHNETLLTGAPGAISFLAQRFAGQTPVNSCP